MIFKEGDLIDAEKGTKVIIFFGYIFLAFCYENLIHIILAFFFFFLGIILAIFFVDLVFELVRLFIKGLFCYWKCSVEKKMKKLNINNNTRFLKISFNESNDDQIV